MSAVSSTLRTSLAVFALTVLLAGCGDDGSDESPSSDASSSTSAAADDAVATLVQSGLDQLAAGDDAAAAGTFENVLDLDPTNVYAHYNLGVIAQGQGDVEGAMAAYDQALASDAEFGPALYNKAYLTEDTDLEEAVAIYRQAVEADPEFAPAFMRLGFALVHLGADAEGAEFLEQGIALDPAMAEVDAPSYR